MRRVGTQKHYQANLGSPLFDELRSITRKTVGLADPLRVALTPLTKQITAAFIYGSVAKRRDAAANDIDLMALSDSLTYSEICSVREAASEQLGRTVNPTVYSAAEWSKRARSGNAFVIRVMAQPKLSIIGSENDLPA
jgi:hypothetical protein